MDTTPKTKPIVSEDDDRLYQSPVSDDTLQDRWEKAQKLDAELSDQQRLQLLIQNEINLDDFEDEA